MASSILDWSTISAQVWSATINYSQASRVNVFDPHN